MKDDHTTEERIPLQRVDIVVYANAMVERRGDKQLHLSA